jgi:MFS family permease
MTGRAARIHHDSVGPRLGLRANAAQFSLLVGLNALVGAMVGLERSVLPLVGREEFGVGSSTAVLTFIVGFGAAKAVANLASGHLADRRGRRWTLVAGWALALPVPLLLGIASSWAVVVAANVLLGASQGLAWSMTVLMKIDLAGERRRGLALGLNESAGYLGVAVAAFATGVLAAVVAPITVVWVGALAVALAGLAVTLLFVRDTSAHVRAEERGSRASLPKTRVVAAASQAGLVNNLNDALAWGLAPLYLAAHGASARQVGVVAAAYPAVWGVGQLGTGALSDRVGRRAPIVAGMLVQAGALAILAADGRFWPALAAAVLLGIGTALVYPALIAAVSDAVAPRDRARAIGGYRFWRDSGLVAGALVVGLAADALGAGAAIWAVAALTAGSGLAFHVLTAERRPRFSRQSETDPDLGLDRRAQIWSTD